MNEYKGNFNTLHILRTNYPVGKSGWFANVQDTTYIWNSLVKDWLLNNGKSNFSNITGNPGTSSALIALIESLEVRYPKDYIDTTLEIRNHEHYAVWFELKNDGIINNDGVLIIN